MEGILQCVFLANIVARGHKELFRLSVKTVFMNVYHERLKNLWMWLIVTIAIIGLVQIGFRTSNCTTTVRFLIAAISLMSILGVLWYFWRGRSGVLCLLSLYAVITVATPVYWAISRGKLFDVSLISVLVGDVAIIANLINTLKIETILSAHLKADYPPGQPPPPTNPPADGKKTHRGRS